MPEPKFKKGDRVKVNNRDIRGLPWYPKFEGLQGEVGSVVSSEYWSTYYLPGEDVPTDVYNYDVEFMGSVTEGLPQVILEAEAPGEGKAP